MIIKTTTAEPLLLYCITSMLLHLKMKAMSMWIFGLLCLSLSGAHGLHEFPGNFVVAKRNSEDPVVLTCSTNTEGNVTWNFNGEEIDVDLEDHLQQDGLHLTVSEVGTPTLGEYSCWRGGSRLSSTYLLLEAEEDSPLSCQAKSYDCFFSCSWTNTEYEVVRLGLGPECTEGEQSCQWVSSRDLHSDGTFQFEVPHAISPYTEESTVLEVTAEAIADLSILRKTIRFYLREIVKPDSPQIVRCQEMEQDLNVTIDPPSSWSTPHSFFSLEHEIEYVLKDNGKTGRSLSTLIPKTISKLRVRSRDSLVLSDWSQWTPWKNVTY
ncbi:interleukin-12 subunit beta [Cheilinus undulatus]|uniref:interleukin-12 subunit beta n=1 Tax=Cheilinus undulatus TaxID=241271 RepID=UPI001BD3E05F|nr:interleukin-12 subunit beta [Cheilinus undulatus]